MRKKVPPIKKPTPKEPLKTKPNYLPLLQQAKKERPSDVGYGFDVCRVGNRIHDPSIHPSTYESHQHQNHNRIPKWIFFYRQKLMAKNNYFYKFGILKSFISLPWHSTYPCQAKEIWRQILTAPHKLLCISCPLIDGLSSCWLGLAYGNYSRSVDMIWYYMIRVHLIDALIDMVSAFNGFLISQWSSGAVVADRVFKYWII